MVEDREGALKLARDAVVVDHEAVGLLGRDAILRAGEAAIHARDRLQQRVLADRAVEVEDLFDGRVEAGDQLVDDDEDLRLAVRVGELSDDLVLVQFARHLELGAVVVGRRDDRVGGEPEVR